MSIKWSEVQQRPVELHMELMKHCQEANTYTSISLVDLVRALDSLSASERAELRRVLGGPEPKPGEFWMELHDGTRFDVGVPTVNQVCFTEIARGLARTNRYAGATNAPVSVLLHQLIAYQDAHTTPGGDLLVPEYMLHHDDAEAIVGDLTYPVKALLRQLSGGRSAYDVVEERIQSTIWAALKLPPPDSRRRDLMKRFDLRARAAERRVFMPNTPDDEWESLAGVETDSRLVDYATTLGTRMPGNLVETWLRTATEAATARGVALPRRRPRGCS